MPTTHAELEAWHARPRRRSDVIGNETRAHRNADGSFTIWHFQTPIATLAADGTVTLESVYASQTTRVRLNGFFQHTRWSFGSSAEEIGGQVACFWFGDAFVDACEPLAMFDRFGFRMPMVRGFRSDFAPTEVEIALQLGARIGERRATDRLVAMLDARGEHAAASAFRACRGKRYECKSCIKAMTTCFEDYFSAPHESGMWIVGYVTRRLIRPLTRREVEIEGADPRAGVIVIGGVKHGLEDGAVNVAREKNTPRPIVACDPDAFGDSRREWIEGGGWDGGEQLPLFDAA